MAKPKNLVYRADGFIFRIGKSPMRLSGNAFAADTPAYFGRRLRYAAWPHVTVVWDARVDFP